MSSRSERGLGTSAAWRLALPGIAVLAIGSAVVMATGYALLSASVRARGDAWLEAEVESIVMEARDDASTLRPGDLEQEVHELEMHEGLAPGEPDDDEDEDEGFFFLAVVGSGDRVLVSAYRGPSWALSAVLAAASRAQGQSVWVPVSGLEYPVRVVNRSIDGERRVIGGATPYADTELMEDIRDLAVASWLVMLAIGVPAVWFEVRRALRRVDRLTEVAGSISAASLSRRLPVGRGRDEIDRLAATFNALLDRAATAVDQLRTMSGAMAHDLRTPLTAIRGALERATKESDPERLGRSLDQAIHGIDDLASFLDATLDVVEAEGGALRLHRSQIGLSSLAKDLVELYEPAALDAGLLLSLESPAEVSVTADRALLSRALINLLDNAVAHLPAGTRVTLEVGATASRAVLAVRDDGPGFPEEVRHHAFERLVRGAASQGHGLGLAMVRAVALAHGGSATLEQPQAGGSIVRIEIPL